MTDIHLHDAQDGMAPERLQRYVDDLMHSTHKTRREIEDELMQHGLDHETASSMVTNALDAQWRSEGGGGPALGRVGPRHMMFGTLLIAVGVAATVASYYSVITFGVPVAFVFYGAIGAGVADFGYGLMRSLGG